MNGEKSIIENTIFIVGQNLPILEIKILFGYKTEGKKSLSRVTEIDASTVFLPFQS